MSCDQYPKFSNVPYDNIADKNGKITNAWRAYNSNNVEQLIGYFTPEGYVLPSRTADDISTLTGNKYIGRIIFNCTDNTVMVNLNGTFVNVNTD